MNTYFLIGGPKVIINDNGMHICNGLFEKLRRKYGVVHKIRTSYHLQTNGQAELANWEMKNILKKTIDPNRRD